MADTDIRFDDPRDAETGWLTNFYRHPFRYEGSDYPIVVDAEKVRFAWRILDNIAAYSNLIQLV